MLTYLSYMIKGLSFLTTIRKVGGYRRELMEEEEAGLPPPRSYKRESGK
jgi:hypothetical protein